MNAPAPPTPPPANSPRGSLTRSLAAIALALCAGAIAFGIVQGVNPLFRVPKEFEAPSIGMAPEVYLNNRRAQERVDRWHAMVYVAMLGALVAGSMAVARTPGRHAWLAPLVAAPLGALGGALGGYVGSRVQVFMLERFGQQELQHTVLIQSALLVPLAVAIGVGVWLARPEPRRLTAAIAGGLGAGLIAAVAFPIAMSIFRPGSSTDHLLPTDRGSLLLWYLLVAAIIGGVLSLAGRQQATNATRIAD